MSNYYVDFPAVIHINNIVLFYGIKILNGKMGEPNAYLYENCRTPYRKITFKCLKYTFYALHIVVNTSYSITQESNGKI